MDTRRKIRPRNFEREPEEKPKPPPVIVAPVWMAVSRGVACFLGMVILLFLFGEIKHRGANASIWWTYPLPIQPTLIWAFLSVTGIELIGFFLLPKMSLFRRWITFTLVLMLFAGALKDSYLFFQLYKSKAILTDFPIPFSLHLAAALTIILPGIMITVDHQGSIIRNFFTICTTVILCTITFPLALLFCVGHVNHQQKTTLAIIPGSTITSGKTSLKMIHQRVKTGYQLYQKDQIKKLCFASGQKIDGIPEAEIMKELAIKLGVDSQDIIVENKSITFRETVQATAEIVQEQKIENIMLVNDFKSIARTKLYFQRAGINTLTTTVPQFKDDKLSLKTIQNEAVNILKFYFRPLE